MFPNDRLPTLDTEIWLEGGYVRYAFYEKPQCPNKVLQRETALADSMIFASLNQEVVRRMLNCCDTTPLIERQHILSRFGQKLLNSGFSLSSAQVILVHGLTRYFELVRLSELNPNHKNFRPLHQDKSYNMLKRRLRKYTLKSG